MARSMYTEEKNKLERLDFDRKEKEDLFNRLDN